MDSTISILMAVFMSFPNVEYERTDHWEATTSGDCKNIAAAYYQEAVRRGVDLGAMRYAVVRLNDGRTHAVLVVKVGDKDIVLDRRQSGLREKGSHRLQVARWIYEKDPVTNKLLHY